MSGNARETKRRSRSRGSDRARSNTNTGTTRRVRRRSVGPPERDESDPPNSPRESDPRVRSEDPSSRPTPSAFSRTSPVPFAPRSFPISPPSLFLNAASQYRSSAASTYSRPPTRAFVPKAGATRAARCSAATQLGHAPTLASVTVTVSVRPGSVADARSADSTTRATARSDPTPTDPTPTPPPPPPTPPASPPSSSSSPFEERSGRSATRTIATSTSSQSPAPACAAGAPRAGGDAADEARERGGDGRRRLPAPPRRVRARDPRRRRRPERRAGPRERPERVERVPGENRTVGRKKSVVVVVGRGTAAVYAAVLRWVVDEVRARRVRGEVDPRAVFVAEPRLARTPRRPARFFSRSPYPAASSSSSRSARTSSLRGGVVRVRVPLAVRRRARVEEVDRERRGRPAVVERDEGVDELVRDERERVGGSAREGVVVVVVRVVRVVRFVVGRVVAAVRVVAVGGFVVRVIRALHELRFGARDALVDGGLDVGVELGRGSHDVEVEPGGDAEIRRGSVDGGEGVLAHVRSQGLEEGREVAFGEPGAARAVSVEPDELHLDRERLLERGREALDLRVQRPAARAAGAAEVRLVGRAQVRVRVPRREGSASAARSSEARAPPGESRWGPRTRARNRGGTRARGGTTRTGNPRDDRARTRRVRNEADETASAAQKASPRRRDARRDATDARGGARRAPRGFGGHADRSSGGGGRDEFADANQRSRARAVRRNNCDELSFIFAS